MVQFIAGRKGEGKTKKLLDMVNKNAKTADGNLIFIDDDRRHMYDLPHDIRFVETGKHFLSNTREFVGYLLGIMVMDNDIEHIYVDGLTNIVDNLDKTSKEFNDQLLELTNRLKSLSEQSTVHFTVCINCDKETLPDEIKAILI
jgi:hypothetical protein